MAFPEQQVVCRHGRVARDVEALCDDARRRQAQTRFQAPIYDRGTKWEAYQCLPSLTDYVLVAQSQIRVEHYRREADGSWRYEMLGAGGTIRLSGGLALDVDALYRGAFELLADDPRAQPLSSA